MELDSGNHLIKPVMTMVIVMLAVLLVCIVPTGCSLFSNEKQSNGTQPANEDTKVNDFIETYNQGGDTVGNAMDRYKAFSSSHNSNKSEANAKDLCSKYLPTFRELQTTIQGYRNKLNTMSFSDKDYTQALELEKQSMAQADLALNSLCEGMQTVISGNPSTGTSMINNSVTQMDQAVELHNQSGALF